MKNWSLAARRQRFCTDSRAHIGTDRLHRILPVFRGRMESLGVRFHWNTRLDGLVLDSGRPRRARAVRTSAGEMPCDAVLLALGHSAAGQHASASRQGVRVGSQTVSAGCAGRASQELINRGRYGEGPGGRIVGSRVLQPGVQGRRRRADELLVLHVPWRADRREHERPRTVVHQWHEQLEALVAVGQRRAGYHLRSRGVRSRSVSQVLIFKRRSSVASSSPAAATTRRQRRTPRTFSLEVHGETPALQLRVRHLRGANRHVATARRPRRHRARPSEVRASDSRIQHGCRFARRIGIAQLGSRSGCPATPTHWWPRVSTTCIRSAKAPATRVAS